MTQQNPDDPNRPQPFMPCYRPEPPKTELATLGRILGLSGLMLFFFPIIGSTACPLTIIGLVLSCASRSRGFTPRFPLGLATAGIWCSAVGLGICTLWIVDTGHRRSDRSRHEILISQDQTAPHTPPTDRCSAAPSPRPWSRHALDSVAASPGDTHSATDYGR